MYSEETAVSKGVFHGVMQFRPVCVFDATPTGGLPVPAECHGVFKLAPRMLTTTIMRNAWNGVRNTCWVTERKVMHFSST